MDANSSDMKAVLEAVKDTSPRIIEYGGALFLAYSSAKGMDGGNGWHVEEVTEQINAQLPAPDRRRGTSHHGSLASFLAHLTSAGHDDTARAVAYANPEGPSVSAIYNYWGGWRDFRAEWTCDLSPEFEAWSKIDRQHLNQTTFAEFLLENMGDILEAESMDAAGMLEAAKDLEINRDVAFASRIDLTSGAAQFKYEDADKNTGAVMLPREFTIRVNIFCDDADETDVRCQLRYRVIERNLKLGIVMLPRPKVLIRKALEAALSVIRDRAGVEVFVGTAES